MAFKIFISNLASIPPSTDQRSGLCSGHRVTLHLLSHLFGTVVGQAKTHDGHHHGDLVEGAALRLGLNLTSYLPLGTHMKKKKTTHKSAG